MNYFEKHIGDWIKDTIRLDAMEEGVYSRLIDQYYQSEKPLPLDIKEVYKLARVSKKAEKDAVDRVLEKYFDKTSQGFVQKRAQEEIEKFWDKDADSDAKKDNAKERQQRARERRKALFDELSSHGVVPAWNTTTGQLRALLSRVTSRDDHAPVTPEITRDTTAIQSPVTSNQYPVNQDQSLSLDNSVGAAEENPEAERPIPNRSTQIAILLRGKGVKPFSFAHPLAMEWGNDPKITDDILNAAVQQARDYKPKGDISPNYLKPIIEQLANPPPPTESKPQQDAWWLTNAGIERKGQELGMTAYGGQSYNDFKDRIFAEIRKRNGGKAA